MKRAIALAALAAALSGCASLAVRPCDSIAERDGKYVSRFFLGVLTLGISEAAIHQEQWLEAREGWRFCPPPSALQGGPPPAAWQGVPPPTAAGPRTPGLLVNSTKWTVIVYLDSDPAASGVIPSLTLRPGEGRRLALLAGPHRIVARPVGEPSGAPAPAGKYEREIQIDPRDRGFRLQLLEGEFR
jgi:hypothetical protein